METVIIALLVVLVVAVVWFGMNQNKSDDSTSLLVLQKETESLRRDLHDTIANNASLVNQQLSNITTQVNKQLESVTSQVQTSTGQINVRMDNAANAVKEVSKTLGEFESLLTKLFP